MLLSVSVIKIYVLPLHLRLEGGAIDDEGISPLSSGSRERFRRVGLLVPRLAAAILDRSGELFHCQNDLLKRFQNQKFYSNSLFCLLNGFHTKAARRHGIGDIVIKQRKRYVCGHLVQAGDTVVYS